VSRAAKMPPEWKPWLVDRTSAPPIAPSSPPLVPRDAIVIVLSTDALRADVLSSDAHAGPLPNLTTPHHDGVVFPQAHSPASQTVYAVTTMFGGSYFSQQYWTPKRDGEDSYLWPHEDPTIRFPEVLARAGIPTVTFAAAFWLTNAWGVVRGFTEESILPPSGK